MTPAHAFLSVGEEFRCSSENNRRRGIAGFSRLQPAFANRRKWFAAWQRRASAAIPRRRRGWWFGPTAFPVDDAGQPGAGARGLRCAGPGTRRRSFHRPAAVFLVAGGLPVLLDGLQQIEHHERIGDPCRPPRMREMPGMSGWGFDRFPTRAGVGKPRRRGRAEEVRLPIR